MSKDGQATETRTPDFGRVRNVVHGKERSSGEEEIVTLSRASAVTAVESAEIAIFSPGQRWPPRTGPPPCGMKEVIASSMRPCLASDSGGVSTPSSERV